ncbi:MAG: S-methyl-5-thioribose-1-phosphate isomerase [bacterium]
MIETIKWDDRGRILLLDQTLLPHRVKYRTLRRVDDVAKAIRTMQVRGAPAIGVTAAMGMALGALTYEPCKDGGFREYMDGVGDKLAATRPTAVNLFWAIQRMKDRIDALDGKPPGAVRRALVAEAKRILREDVSANRRLSEYGAALIKKGSTVITHCNAGSLATGGYGTALGVIRTAYRQGRVRHVFVDETRPRLQGAHLTAFELIEEKIPATLICDNSAGALMAQGRVQCAVVGADRIAANGDTANKIGTYSLAVLARAHKIPFFVAAPLSTVDFSLRSGKQIPIEERHASETTTIHGTRICPKNMPALNMAFDVTPYDLISAIVTEKGVARKPYGESLKKLRCRQGR